MKMTVSLLLNTAALNADTPSKTCRVRVSSTRYRNDPYRAKVVPRCPHKDDDDDREGGAVAAGSGSLTSLQQRVPAASTSSPMDTGIAHSAPSFASSTSSFTAPEMLSPLGMPRQQPPELPPPMMARSEPALTSSSSAASSCPTDHVVPCEPAFSTVPGVRYAVVGFKHECGTFQAPFRVAIGDVVIVEADRGEHIGTVQSISLEKPAFNVPSRILRRASAGELVAIEELTQKERKVTTKVQRVAEGCGLGIQVLDTEFQLDGNKLTVFFASKTFVDFRKLQRTLFRDFRTRIWLVNWNEVKLYTPVVVSASS